MCAGVWGGAEVRAGVSARRRRTEVGVQGGGPLVGEVEARTEIARQAPELAEHVGEVKVVAVKADGTPRELGGRHLLQADEEGLRSTARLQLEGDDTYVDMRVLVRQVEVALVLRVQLRRNDDPEDVAEPELERVDEVEHHGPAGDLDERLGECVSGVAKRVRSTAHRNDHV